jgi:hypothetical protein
MLVIQWIVVGLGVLILMVVEWILSLFSVDLGSLGQSLQQAFEQLELLLASPMPETPPVDQSASSPAILRILQALVTVGLPALVVVLVLVLTWRRVRAARPGRREDDERESLLSARVVASSLQSALRGGLDQLSRLAEATGKLGPAGRFFAALSVRRIYANLIRLAAESGHPRAEAQTPYEYLPTLLGAFPDNVEEVKAITEAYVGAHYGQLPDSQQELQRLRACWDRIRAWSVSK